MCVFRPDVTCFSVVLQCNARELNFIYFSTSGPCQLHSSCFHFKFLIKLLIISLAASEKILIRLGKLPSTSECHTNTTKYSQSDFNQRRLSLPLPLKNMDIQYFLIDSPLYYALTPSLFLSLLYLQLTLSQPCHPAT